MFKKRLILSKFIQNMIFIYKIYSYCFIHLMFFSLSINSIFAQGNDVNNTFFNEFYSFRFNSAYKICNLLKADSSLQTKYLLKSYYFSNISNFDKSELNIDSSRFFAKEVSSIISKKKELTDIDYFDVISSQAVILKVDFKKNNYLSAFVNFLKFDKYLEYLLENDDKTPEFKLTSGLYYYYIYLAQEDYPLLYPLLLFYPSGNKNRGLKLLTECSNSNNIFINTESSYYLARIYRRDEKSYIKSKYYFEKLLNSFPENLFWQYEYTEALKYFGKFDAFEKQLVVLAEKLNTNIEITKSQRLLFKNRINELKE